MDASAKQRFHKVGRFGSGRVQPIKVRRIHLDILKTLFDHHTLPTNIIRQLVDPNVSQRTISRACNEMKHLPNAHIIQPKGQERARDARCAFLIFQLSSKGAQVLVEHGRISYDDYLLWAKVREQYRQQHFIHDLVTGYVSSSIELGCRELGYKFLSWHFILNRPKCPQVARDADNPLGIPYKIRDGKSYCTPDALYGIEYGSGGIFFAAEIDMGTEQQDERKDGGTSITQKARTYRQIIHSKSYADYLGLPSLQPVFFSTSIVRLHNIARTIAAVATKDGKGSASAFKFKAVIETANYVGQPIPADGRVLKEPYMRIDGKPVDLAKV